MAKGIGAKLFIDGEKEFRSAISDSNNILKMLKSTLGVVSSQFRSNDQSIDSYKQKNTATKKVLDQLKTTLDLQQQGLEHATKQYGEASSEATAWQTSVNKTQKEINKLTMEVEDNDKAIENLEKGLDANGNEMKDTAKEAGKLGDALDDTSDDANQLGSSFNGMNTSLSVSVKNLLTTFGVIEAGRKVFGMLEDSIGSAMDRLDTMNQFSRVMTTMTGSAEIANTALESIKDTVTGTAYGLDVAAKSTQKFVTSGMDINKATQQIEIWGDAVAFYSDGTNSSFESVTDAMAKMVSKGKVGMDQMNRLTDAGIPAVQIYADAVGRSMGDVQAELSNGTISAQDFLDTLENAMRGGTQSFASIEGAAKEAGASWNGTIDNMKAAFTRGVADMMENIDKGMNDAGLGSLKENIASFGKATENVLKKLGQEIPKVIKLLKDLKPVIMAIGTAWVASKITGSVMDTTKKVLSFKDGILNALKATKGDGLKTFATQLTKVGSEGGDASGLLGKLGTAMGNIDPVKLGLTVGVGLLVGGITLLKEVTDPTTESQKKLRSSLEESGKAMDGLKEQTTKSVEEAISMDNHYVDLRNRLSEIVDENGKVKEGYQGTAQVILNELNEAYGTNIQMVDGVIQKYGEQMQALDEVMEKSRANAVLEAHREEYNEAIANLDSYKNSYQEAYNDMSDSYSEFMDMYAQKRKEGLSREDAYWETFYSSVEMQNTMASRQFQTTWDLFEKAEKQVLRAEQIQRNFQKAEIAYYEGDLQKMEDIFQTHSYNMQKIEDQNLQQLEENLATAQAERDSAAMIRDTTQSADLKKKMQTEIDGYNKDIALLEQNIADRQGMISGSEPDIAKAWQTLVDSGVTTTLGGVESMDQAGQALMGALEDGVDYKQIDATTAVRRVTDGMVAEVNGKYLAFDSAGKYVGEVAADAYESVDWNASGANSVYGLVSGTKSSYALSVVRGGFASLGNTALAAFRSSVGEKSPWKSTEQSGRFAVEGLAGGVKKNIEKAKTAFRDLADVSKVDVDPNALTQQINAASASIDHQLNTVIDDKVSEQTQQQVYIAETVARIISNKLNGAKVVMDKREVGKLVVEVSR